MSTIKHSFRLAVVLFALGLFSGCESTDGGSASSSVGVYYGVGFYDPWYYGDYDQDIDVDIDRPDRPDRPGNRPRPEQPIARPQSSPSVHSSASIPSAPRPAMRGGGGGGGRR